MLDVSAISRILVLFAGCDLQDVSTICRMLVLLAGY